MSIIQADAVEMSVEEVTALVGTIVLAGREVETARGVDYSTPENAAGKCLTSTADVLEVLRGYKADEHVKVVYAEHPDLLAVEIDDDDETYYNHYALILPNKEQTVVDFTMRQFYPKSNFPYIAPLDVWNADLAQVWGTFPATSIGNDICYLCEVGIDTACECM